MEYNLLLLYLLIIIKNSNDIYLLLEKCNISSIELNNVYMKALELGFISERKDEAILTKKGEEEIINLRKKLKLKGINSFVVPYYLYKREVISEQYIYIPANEKGIKTNNYK